VLAFIGHGVAIKEPTKNLDRLGESGLADRGWIEFLTDGLVLGEGVPRTDSNFDATPAQMIEAG
jgi:hypothetical protein